MNEDSLCSFHKFHCVFFLMKYVVEKCFHVFLFYTHYKTVVFYPWDRALDLFLVCIFSVHVVCMCGLSLVTLYDGHSNDECIYHIHFMR